MTVNGVTLSNYKTGCAPNLQNRIANISKQADNIAKLLCKDRVKCRNNGNIATAATQLMAHCILYAVKDAFLTLLEITQRPMPHEYIKYM